MKKITGVITLSLFTVLTVWSVGAKNPVDITGTQAKWPEGKWQFSAHPYSGPDYQSRAVRVTSVGTTREDLMVSLVRVKNVSDKAVAAVKLGWRLYSDQDPDAILNSGETALIAVSGGLPVGQGTVLKFSMVSFLKLSQPLLKAGKLEGHFRIDVVATEVLYQDGTSWVPTKETTRP